MCLCYFVSVRSPVVRNFRAHFSDPWKEVVDEPPLDSVRPKFDHVQRVCVWNG